MSDVAGATGHGLGTAATDLVITFPASHPGGGQTSDVEDLEAPVSVATCLSCRHLDGADDDGVAGEYAVHAHAALKGGGEGRHDDWGTRRHDCDL